ncbi:MAG: dephospho-CoA kinase [Chloroflexi bacterium]|nr:dephospho-CoA kinase [Chloroflexota bacterium]
MPDDAGHVYTDRGNHMLVIGLTGGIGTGKSTVTQTLAELGAVVINADLVGHTAYLPHQNVWQDVVDAFGAENILGENDEVDRRKLGAVVFGSPEALARLNGIVHPWMFGRMKELLKDEEDKGVQVVVLEAAILIEANWTPLVNQVWVTVASEDNVVQRVQARNNFSEEQIRARIRSQTSDDVRTTRADVVIDTNGTIDDVVTKVKELWELAVVKKV